MTSQATLTDLLRTPKQVILQADNGEVRITRRGSEDLVMLRASDLAHKNDGFSLASTILRATLRTNNVRTALEDAFAWTGELNEREMADFAEEMTKMVWAAADLGQYKSLLIAFNAWRETALAYAAGMPRGTGSDADWFSSPVPISKP